MFMRVIRHKRYEASDGISALTPVLTPVRKRPRQSGLAAYPAFQSTRRLAASGAGEKRRTLKLVVDGEEAAGVIHEISLVKDTGLEFEIEFIQWLTIRNGKIVRWKSYTDPSQIILALKPLAAKAIAGVARARSGLKETQR
jgi:ketosteroid isomerase-like protein